ncbi:ATP-binding protein [Streptomyces sp. NPDC046976]|uniref:ATP-binding protein n=1 Tax=Streptomyces sp. NPDC046976 TaxID=3155258 RepID=UPI0033CDB171
MNAAPTIRTAPRFRTGGRRPVPAEPMAAVAEFDGDLGCIAAARHRAARFLSRARTEHGVAVSARALDLTRLVVSEMVTNACKYAPGPIRMELRITGARTEDPRIEISVLDTVPLPPVVRAAEPRRVGQHGLEIVLAVAESFEMRPEPPGKRITVRLALTDSGVSGVSGDTGGGEGADRPCARTRRPAPRCRQRADNRPQTPASAAAHTSVETRMSVETRTSVTAD